MNKAQGLQEQANVHFDKVFRLACIHPIAFKMSEEAVLMYALRVADYARAAFIKRGG